MKVLSSFYPLDDTHDSTISQVSVFYYRSAKIIRTLWIFRLCRNSILQMKYDILSITSIVNTVKMIRHESNEKVISNSEVADIYYFLFRTYSEYKHEIANW